VPEPEPVTNAHEYEHPAICGFAWDRPPLYVVRSPLNGGIVIRKEMPPNRYDPMKPPADGWLGIDEGERHELVRIYHKRKGLKPPNMNLHLVVHVVVENQLAERLPEVMAAMERLTSEGLDRHDAIHAIGSVLLEHLVDVTQGRVSNPDDPHAPYFASLKRLTAASWRSSG
jgi:hypothetical protein